MRDGLKKLRDIIVRIPRSGMRIGRSLTKVKELNFTLVNTLRSKAKNAAKKVQSLNRRIITTVKKVLGKTAKFLEHPRIKQTADIVKKVTEQSIERMSGIKPTQRIISIADPEARPIVKGKLDKPVEFGGVALLAQDASGYVTQYAVHHGNPSDSGMVEPLLKKHQEQFPGSLKQIAADTGFASELNVEILAQAGVSKIGIPCRGRPSPQQRLKQQRPWFKALRRFRAGIEACIRFLDRKFGLKRMFRGNAGTFAWVSWTVIAANLYRYAKLS
jgi:IS5 family transposase